MKILAALLLVSSVFAANKVKKKEVKRYFGCTKSGLTTAQKKKCKFLSRGLTRDIKKCLIDPRDVFSEIGISSAKTVKGTISYLGIMPLKYKYKMTPNSSRTRLNIKVRVAFKNAKKFSKATLRSMQEKMNEAAELWRDRNTSGYPVSFTFLLVDKKSKPDFKVKLLSKYTRGPYNSKWSTTWSSRTIAHEVGHMMGLDDEYKNGLGGGDTSVCNTSSLMCSSGSGLPNNVHYYVMLRRMFCK